MNTVLIYISRDKILIFISIRTIRGLCHLMILTTLCNNLSELLKGSSLRSLMNNASEFIIKIHQTTETKIWNKLISNLVDKFLKGCYNN